MSVTSSASLVSSDSVSSLGSSPIPVQDPALDVLRSADKQPLNAIFAPKSVAVIGATERLGSVGRTILWNLISSPFGGTVYPVNPKRNSVLGIKAYPSLAAIGEPVDLAVIVTPAATVPSIMGECVAAGGRGAIIISAGFKETGPEGIALEQDILEIARQGNIRVVGPNCLGVMCPVSGLNATFASVMAQQGSVGFISQSGALCTAILDWSFRENVGFSAFMSIGSMLDVNWGDLIYYLGDDPNTHSIVIYMETIGDARSFLSAAREVALTKPILVINAGRTEAAAQAAASHTGSLAGSDAVMSAAFRRCGVLRVDSIEDLFNMAEVLAKQPRPRGKRLTILTNAGGPGVLATDALISGGGELATLSPETKAALDQILPIHWSHGNPIDILGDADPERYAKALEIAVREPNSDGMLVILTPQAMTDPLGTAERLREIPTQGKPMLASWMGGDSIFEAELKLNQADIFTLPYPDTAAQVFNYMWRYAYNLAGLYETPVFTEDDKDSCPQRDRVAQLIAAARQEGRTLLTEYESKQLLAAYGIPTVPTEIATSSAAAIAAADKIGYPVVLKLHSNTITHKTDVGGVKLNLGDANAVEQAFQAIQDSLKKLGHVDTDFLGVTVQPMVKLSGYELILGSSLDPQFGPVLLFGTGGQLVEVFKDRALALPPLNTTLARRLMEQTRIYEALQGVRGRKAVDLPALEQLLVKFSQLVVEQSWIKEIDINPLLARPQADTCDDQSPNLVALDARVVLHPPDMPSAELPRLAIRPYPMQYASEWQLRTGDRVTIRPIRPEDEPLMVKFHQSLSEESVYLRYAHLFKLSHRVAHARMVRICFVDYDRDIVLVADQRQPDSGEHQLLAAARLSKLHGTNDAEFALLVSDHYQGQGLGTELVRRLLAIAKDEALDQVIAEILPDNRAMQHICKKLGFTVQTQTISTEKHNGYVSDAMLRAVYLIRQ